MKRIALLTDGWHRFMTNDWSLGIEAYLKKRQSDMPDSEEIQVFQYQCWGNWSQNERHNRGEYNLFSLPVLSEYDGIILDSTNIIDLKVRERIRRLAADSGVPAVSLCLEQKGMYYVGIDGRGAVQEIMSHLYEEHGCRTFAFVNGPDDNYESSERRRAFELFLRERGMEEEAAHILQGGFDYSDGVEAFRALHAAGPLPEAVICVNDNVAIGLISEAEHHGLRVPEDFLVTGFDRLDKADYYLPQITSGSLDRYAIAMTAVKTLIRLWEGEPVDLHTFTPTAITYTESCGCPNSGKVRYREYMKYTVLKGIHEDRREMNNAAFEARLSEVETFEEMRDTILDFYRELGCDACFLILDGAIIEAGPDAVLPDRGYEISRLTGIYGFLPSDCGQQELPEDYASVRAWLRGQGSAFYFCTPLHFGPHAAGVLLTVNPKYLRRYYDLYKINEMIQNALETSFQSRQLRGALARLQEIYHRDQLTGVYARTAYEEVLRPLYDRTLCSGGNLALFFVDADHFKELNDTYGHEYGDSVLIRIARCASQLLPETGCVCRYGGDEFIVLLPYEKDGQPQQYCRQLRSSLEAEGISVSMGAAEARKGDSLETCIAEADRRMYMEKNRRRGEI